MEVPRKKWLIGLCLVWTGTVARAEPVTTMPLQWYGLGSLECAAYSPDNRGMSFNKTP